MEASRVMAIEKATCSCGGEVEKDDTTLAEDRKYHNCNCGCCLLKLVCQKCRTTFYVKLEAPEIE